MSAKKQAATGRRGRAATAAKLAMHEAVCAERYGTMLARMARMEVIIISAAGTLIAALALVAWSLVSHGLTK